MEQNGATKADGGGLGAAIDAMVSAPNVENLGDEPGDIHRIGGATIENLRLKPREASLKVPGISVIKAPTPDAAAQEIRAGFPKATGLHEQAKTIGTTSEEALRSVGFDIIPARSTALPNHHRIIHPNGVDGFSDANLVELAKVFVNSTGH